MKAKLMAVWSMVSDKARTGVLIAATVLMLWWLRDALAGSAQWLLVGALAATFSAVTAYWADRCLFPDSRPHAVPVKGELWKWRVFAETRRLVIFLATLATVTAWFKGSLFVF